MKENDSCMACCVKANCISLVMSEYNKNNAFYKIIHKELPADIVQESEHSLAFNDIHPQDSFHILIIPKGEYIDLYDFWTKATDAEKLDFFDLIVKIKKKYKNVGGHIRINFGNSQEVPHLHAHVLMH